MTVLSTVLRLDQSFHVTIPNVEDGRVFCCSNQCDRLRELRSRHRVALEPREEEVAVGPSRWHL